MYLKRYVEKEIELALKSSGAVLIAGPKFCGKTTTCSLYAKSNITLNTKSQITLVEAQPSIALIGENPHMIDEWQTVPDLWNYVREEVDKRQKFGQFILTGSATPASFDDIYHSGAGRISTIIMRPLSLYESLESKGLVSLKELFDNSDYNVFDVNENHSLDDIAFYICRGGWPLSINEDRNISLQVTKNYYKNLFNFENSKNQKFRNKKPEMFRAILKSYARNISTETAKKTIIKDVVSSENRTLSPDTFDSYKEALEDLFIIKDVDAWNPNFRSKTAIQTTPTRHFVDTSIAARALNISPKDLLNDGNTFGLFFEDFAVRDLSIYTQYLGGEVRHFRDGNGLECDAVIHLEDGRYGLIEIKLGGEKLIEEGVKTLNLLEEKIKNNNQNMPKFKMILTATGPCYKRKDGIYIVPINLLKD